MVKEFAGGNTGIGRFVLRQRWRGQKDGNEQGNKTHGRGLLLE